MRLFSKKTNPEGNWASSVLKTLLIIQRKICGYLNDVTKGWSQKTIKRYWLFFILIGISVSLEVAVRAILKYERFPFAADKSRFVIVQPVEGREKNDQLQLQRLRKYEIYLDSLLKHDTAFYKKVIEANPHLRDSLGILDSLLTKNIK